MKKIPFVFLLFLPTVFFTQEKTTTLDELKIIKARTKIKKEREEFRYHAQSVETMDAIELNRNNPAMIEQSLSTLAGLQVEKRTQLGGQRLVLRGYGNDQKFNNWGVKMYWNNIPITNAEGITQLDDVDFSSINQIEVIKGPAGTLYGAGTGGVVRFYTKNTYPKGTTLSEKITVGSFGHFQNYSEVHHTADHYNININYGHIESKGYRPHSDGRKNLLNLTSEIELGKNQKLNLLLNQSFSDEKVAGQIPYAEYLAGNLEANTAYTRKNAKNTINTTRIGLVHQWNILQNIKLDNTVFFSSTQQERISAGAYETATNPNLGIRTKAQIRLNYPNFSQVIEAGMELQNSKSLISNYRLSGSIEEPLETTGIAKATYFQNENIQKSFFATQNLIYQPWQINLLLGFSANQLRYDRQDLLALPNLVENKKDASFQKEYKTVFAPHIAVQKDIKKHIFNLSYSEGYNAPTSSKSFITGNGKSNDALVVEKAKMWDLSIHGLFLDTKLDYQVSIFNIQYQNKLSQLRGNDGQNNYTYWANTGEQQNKGFEMSVGYQQQFKDFFFKKIVPFINYSHYNAKYTQFQTKAVENNTIKDHTNHWVVGVPKNKWAAGFDFYFEKGWYANFTYNYLGGVFTDFDNTNWVQGFGLMNAKVGYQKKWNNWLAEAFVIGNNLTNQIHYTYLYYGNNIGDVDANSNFGNQVTDVNPGPNKAYFFTGLQLSYQF